MCTRNRISPPKDVHKNHKTLRYTTLKYTLPLFDMNRQRGQGEKKVRDEGTNNDNDAWGVRNEWENEAQTLDKTKCYKA